VNKAMPQLETRLARQEDKAAVLAFCAQTWEWGDYLPKVWDDWLADQSGRLLVATLDERPVAVMHLRMVSPEEGWLEGMRVDPAVRGQGISRAMGARGREEARALGARVVRLATHSDNSVAQHALDRDDYERIGTFVVYEAPAEQITGVEMPAPATPADLPDVLTMLDRSSIFPAMGGLAYHDWAGRALTGALLEQRLAGGDVLLLRQGANLQALAICHPQAEGQPDLQIDYLDGATEEAGRLAYGLRAVAAVRGLEQVVLVIPDQLMLRDMLEGIGYQTEDMGAFWVYERALEV
jgi:GNAT superfamily N-acetyltransferase